MISEFTIIHCGDLINLILTPLGCFMCITKIATMLPKIIFPPHSKHIALLS